MIQAFEVAQMREQLVQQLQIAIKRLLGQFDLDYLKVFASETLT